MTDIKETGGKCPSCGKAISGYNPASRDYGSPIRTCKSCGQQYLDTRYIELAVLPPAARDLTPKAGLKVALLGLVLFLAAGALTLNAIRSHGSYPAKGLIVFILSPILIIYGIIDSIRVKTGAKQKSLDKKREESEQRLMDRAYAQQLASLGFDVPDKYL